MASPDETLRDELVRFLTRIPPSRLPQRADGGHYAVALALQRRRAARRQGDGVVAAVGALGQSRWWYVGEEPDELLAEIFLWACHGPPPALGGCPWLKRWLKFLLPDGF